MNLLGGEREREKEAQQLKERERERETSHSCGISNFHGKLEGKVEQEIESSLRRSDKTSVYLSPSLALPVLTLSSLPIYLL